MKRKSLAFVVMAACAWAAFAQTEEPILTVKVIPSAEVFRPDQAYPFFLEITIRSPYHINADIPSEDYLIGTSVDFKSVPGAIFGKLAFPPAEMRRFSFSQNPLAVYQGTVKVTAEIVLAADFKGDKVAIEGTVGYQACNDQSCLPPAEAAFGLTVPVEGAPKALPPVDSALTEKKGQPPVVQPETSLSQPGPQTANEVIAPEEKRPASAQTKPEEIQAVPQQGEKRAPDTSTAGQAAEGPASRFEGKALLPLFLLVFLGGLALNLTPCVYPLIPITVSYFGGQSGGKKGGLVLHAVLYVIGMAITYSVLGSIAAFTGSLFGAALQYPPVLIFIALIMILLSLSMFDVYELRMPGFLNKLAGGSQKGYFGTLFMGLTVGIVAAPCIGPFVLGLLTYVGNRGSVILGFSLFFVLALGLGVPFLFLGIFSGSLNKLPRSGAWMVWVRKVFGFILIAMAIYFLKTLFPTTLLYHLSLALTILIAGLYMAWLEPTQSPGKAFRYVRTIVGLIFFGVALFAAHSGIQGYLDTALATGKGGASLNAIAWSPYSEEKLAEATAAGRPVFIDSFADWCIPCKEMDKLTFSRPEVIAASRGFVMLKADLTSNKDAGVRAFYKKYGIKGVPTLIFLYPDGAEIEELRGTGFESKDVFLSKMKRAIELSKQD
jgi:thiol:disulfide interchange protein DsbD